MKEKSNSLSIPLPESYKKEVLVMKFAWVLLTAGSLVTIGALISLGMSFFMYDPSAIFYVLGSIVVALNGLIAIGVALILKHVKKPI